MSLHACVALLDFCHELCSALYCAATATAIAVFTWTTAHGDGVAVATTVCDSCICTSYAFTADVSACQSVRYTSAAAAATRNSSHARAASAIIAAAVVAAAAGFAPIENSVGGGAAALSHERLRSAYNDDGEHVLKE